jgi:hypothetical protein
LTASTSSGTITVQLLPRRKADRGFQLKRFSEPLTWISLRWKLPFKEQRFRNGPASLSSS